MKCKRYKKNYRIKGWPVYDSKNKTVLSNDKIVDILNNLEAERDSMLMDLYEERDKSHYFVLTFEQFKKNYLTEVRRMNSQQGEL